jgi:hypothetical protein
MPHETCPWCGDTTCYAEFVDVGVGGSGVQVTPYQCDNCGAHENNIGLSEDWRAALAEERRLEAQGKMKDGWWKGPDNAA